MDQMEFMLEEILKPQEWAPGIWAGSEGMKLEIVKVDMQNQTITVKYYMTIVDARNES